MVWKCGGMGSVVEWGQTLIVTLIVIVLECFDLDCFDCFDCFKMEWGHGKWDQTLIVIDYQWGMVEWGMRWWGLDGGWWGQTLIAFDCLSGQTLIALFAS